MRLSYEKHVLNLRNPFRLSYGVSETREAHVICLDQDQGWGEGTIPPYYGVAETAMTAYWDRAARDERPFPAAPEEIAAWVDPDGPAPARAALDLALHDRLGRRLGLPLYRLLELPRPEPKSTSFTIAIDTPEEMARMASGIPDYPVIKIKLGSEDDPARLAAVRRARPDARLRVDANAGWSFEEALQNIEKIAPFDLEMIEQPLPKAEIEGLGRLQACTPIPIVADESVQTFEDVERLAAAGVAGINVKLMKVGGLAPAVRILKRARQLGLRVMLGCMVETSVGTTAMAHLAGLAEWLDLDAPLLIRNDPFDGLAYGPGLSIQVPERPGIGAILKA